MVLLCQRWFMRVELYIVNDEETLKKTQQRVDNVRKALQRDGASILDIDRSLLFKVISILMLEHGLSGIGITNIVEEIVESLEGAQDVLSAEEPHVEH